MRNGVGRAPFEDSKWAVNGVCDVRPGVGGCIENTGLERLIVIGVLVRRSGRGIVAALEWKEVR